MWSHQIVIIVTKLRIVVRTGAQFIAEVVPTISAQENLKRSLDSLLLMQFLFVFRIKCVIV
jgi:hypothetical protein